MGWLVSQLKLSGNRRVKVGMTFECPDDEFLRMSDEDVPITGLGYMSITKEDGSVESAVFLTKEDLERHVYETKAILKSLEEATAIVDRQWQGFKKRRRGDV